MESLPHNTVWMNMTTSENWKRPPVGIVRVELALCEEFEKLFPTGKFKKCVWSDEKFWEISAPVHVHADREHGVAVSSKHGTGGQEYAPPTLRECQFQPGDVLISVGLDWEYSYLKEFVSLKKRGVNVVTCCHDLIPIKFPQFCLDYVAQKFASYLLDLAECSRLVLCVSKQSEKDLRSFLYEAGAAAVDTFVIRHGDRIPDCVGTIDASINQAASFPFILFLSTIERRKNHEVLVRAYQHLCSQGKKDMLPKLFFVGMPGWGVDALLQEIAEDSDMKDLIVQLHHVTDAELRVLYEKALFCVYPSWYEGWGLPVAEALALGKAVLSSDRGSLPEVGGNLVQYIDPGNPEEWAEAIWPLVINPKERRRRETNVGHNYRVGTWADTALNVIDKLTKENTLYE